MIEALLWDIDGVFVDTEEIHFRSWQWLLEQEGKTLTLEEYIPCVGHTGTENIQRLAWLKGISGDLEAKRLLRRQKFEELRKDGAPIIEENIEFLKNFKKEFPNLKYTIVSAASKSDIKINLETAKISEFFQDIISFEENGGMKRKPYPDMYILALDHLNLPASKCIAFEDTESGIISAAEAGIHTVALPNHLTESQDFSRASMVISLGGIKSPKGIIDNIN
ncbi:HAD family phosphatase [Candidatus Parcubacteria bacterium]|nr:HAD family phosphatase [Candidatus Parcubacteria bacterium]